MEKINFLITSAGRRVSLVKIFQNYGNVYTCDMNPFLSSACHVSDGYFEVPRVTDPKYMSIILGICKEKNIKMIIPTIDTELSILSAAKRDFSNEEINIAVSDKNICDTFYYKTSTEEFFLSNGFDTPKRVTDIANAKYPLFAKLNNSSSSIGALKVDSYQSAECLLKDSNYVFQEFVEGVEFTVDVFIDKRGGLVSVVPRQRIEVRAGEISKGKTVKDEIIINKVKELCQKLEGAYGCITIQLFKNSNDISFIEINPRFGGGYPLSYYAGADFAKYLVMDYLDYNLEYNEDWRDNFLMLRYDAEVLVDGNSI